MFKQKWWGNGQKLKTYFEPFFRTFYFQSIKAKKLIIGQKISEIYFNLQ